MVQGEPTSEPGGPRDSVGTSVPWVYFSRLSFALSAGVFYLYIARALPENEVGSVVVVGAIATVSSVLFSLGLGFGLRHFLSFHLGAAEPGPVWRLTRGAYVLSALLTAAAVVTTIGLSSFLNGLFFPSPAWRPDPGLLALYIGLGTASWILRSVLIGLQRFIAYSMISGAGYLTSYALATALLVTRGGINSILLGWTVGTALACALFLVAIRTRSMGYEARHADARRSAQATNSLYWSVLTYSLPLFVAFLVTTGSSYVDRLILASLANLSSVAVYNYALLIVTSSLYVVAPFGTLLLPNISEAFGRRDLATIRKITRSAATLAVLAYVPLGLAVAALAPFLLRLLVGAPFVPATTPLVLLVGMYAATIPCVALSGLATGIRRTTAVVASSGLALVANVTLCFLLVPSWGMMGAAIGNSALPSATFLALYLWLRPTRLVRFDGQSIGRIWLASGAMAAVIALPLSFLRYPIALVPVFLALGLATLIASMRFFHAITRETA